MKRIDYQDISGRWWAVALPDDAFATDAPLGAPIGPPPLDDLGLPEATAVRLHNELFRRGVLTIGDVRRKRQDIISALMAALMVDAERIHAIYEGQTTTEQGVP